VRWPPDAPPAEQLDEKAESGEEPIAVPLGRTYQAARQPCAPSHGRGQVGGIVGLDVEMDVGTRIGDHCRPGATEAKAAGPYNGDVLVTGLGHRPGQGGADLR
jgi:hypothetical protein